MGNYGGDDIDQVITGGIVFHGASKSCRFVSAFLPQPPASQHKCPAGGTGENAQHPHQRFTDQRQD